MANKMLIDATHPEETRVVVLRGNRVEEFDFESASRKQLRGNIYLAKVTRVEPSLQAAFVDYGGNRHGFLAFSEIHPDYYQIPVADRQALIDEEERAHRDAEAEADRRAGGGGAARHNRPHQRSARARVATPCRANRWPATPPKARPISGASEAGGDTTADRQRRADAARRSNRRARTNSAQPRPRRTPPTRRPSSGPTRPTTASLTTPRTRVRLRKNDGGRDHAAKATRKATPTSANATRNTTGDGNGEASGNGGGDGEEEEIVESVGGADAIEEVPDRTPRLRRQYKIQEVIKRRQIMLVQVVKEERGTKGAALTTYLSLAGRYSVLMPNTARGGGISRKITSVQDRKRLKEVAQELEVPEGMGVILRTAGAARTKTEIKRDFEYLLPRVGDGARPDAQVDGADAGLRGRLAGQALDPRPLQQGHRRGDRRRRDAYTEAKDFMRMLMPSHAKNVKPYRESQPLLTRYGIESQLDAMFSPIVQLRSGGYIVINQTEALVAIDVNSGRATREHHIEDTALKTNIEASEEIARQLRLRDLAGLIVIDFIDMDEKRNNRSVERRLKECLKNDRARIQVGRISHFGLMEMSRQRIRTSVLESSTDKCPHCGGTGHVRSVSSVALQVLRMIEETLLRGATHNLIVRTRSDIALYVLNHKRAHLRELEERFRITITITADATMGGQPPFVIERGEQVHSRRAGARDRGRAAGAVAPLLEPEDEEPFVEEEEAEEDETEDEESSEGEESAEAAALEGEPRDAGEREAGDHEAGESADGGDDAGGEGGADGGASRARAVHRVAETVAGQAGAPEDQESAEDEDVGANMQAAPGEPRAPQPQGSLNGDLNGEGELRRRRRRGRRGGRRNRRDREGEEKFAPDHAQGPSRRHGATEQGAPEHGAMEHGTVEHGAIEPELADAVADFGGPPVATERMEPAAPRASAPREPEFGRAEPPASEPPRRRSTVREPVRFPIDDEAPHYSVPASAPSAPEPVMPARSAAAPETPDQSQDDDGKPRRTGWWAKRLMGG